MTWAEHITPLVPYLASLLSVGVTVFHTLEETCFERETFWDYFTRNFRLPAVSQGLGLAVFAGVAAVMCLLACFGFGGNALALSLLVGLRLGDACFSHALLSLVGFSPNPGSGSASFYVAEAWSAYILFPCLIDYRVVLLGALAYAVFWGAAFATRAWLLSRE